MYLFADAALLGLASGPACLASCGPVLAPSLAARGTGLAGTARLLASFLSGRVAGYLVFSVLVWSAGLTAPEAPRSRALVFGLVDLGMAAALVAYGFGTRHCAAHCAAQGSRPTRCVRMWEN
jgi:sulfite exporter TauE/SafE